MLPMVSIRTGGATRTGTRCNSFIHSIPNLERIRFYKEMHSKLDTEEMELVGVSLYPSKMSKFLRCINFISINDE